MYYDEAYFYGCNIEEMIFIKISFVFKIHMRTNLNNFIVKGFIYGVAPLSTPSLSSELNVFAFCGSTKFRIRKVGQPFMLLHN